MRIKGNKKNESKKRKKIVNILEDEKEMKTIDNIVIVIEEVIEEIETSKIVRTTETIVMDEQEYQESKVISMDKYTSKKSKKHIEETKDYLEGKSYSLEHFLNENSYKISKDVHIILKDRVIFYINLKTGYHKRLGLREKNIKELRKYMEDIDIGKDLYINIENKMIQILDNGKTIDNIEENLIWSDIGAESNNRYIEVELISSPDKQKSLSVKLHHIVFALGMQLNIIGETMEDVLNNYDSEETIDHINGEKSDNRLSNLRKLTRKDNGRMGKLHNLKKYSTIGLVER